jgi:hypothetical protein
VEGAVLVVLFRGTAKDKVIVNIDKAEIQVSKDNVHERLELSVGVS